MKGEIKETIKQVFKLEHVKDTISQDTCDKWDSLNHLNLIVELELKFDLSFEPEEIVKMRSLEVIEKIIKEKRN